MDSSVKRKKKGYCYDYSDSDATDDDWVHPHDTDSDPEFVNAFLCATRSLICVDKRTTLSVPVLRPPPTRVPSLWNLQLMRLNTCYRRKRKKNW